jgi:ABC-2 type transport system permease protein
MTSSVAAMTASVPVSGGSRALRRLTLTEAKLFMRERVGLIWGVGFPIVLLIIFGSIPGFRKPISSSVPGLTVLDAYIPILVALVIAMLALSALPSVLASYREKGVLRRMATTPVGPGRVLAAQLAVNVVTFLVTLVLLLAVARLAYGVPLARQFGGFVLAVGFAIAALFGIGLFIAAIASTGRAAQATGTILFFPMMFFAGLWLPIAAMPAVLQHISHATPLGAAVQALTDSWQGHFPHPLQLITLGAYALVFCLAAARLFRWE